MTRTIRKRITKIKVSRSYLKFIVLAIGGYLSAADFMLRGKNRDKILADAKELSALCSLGSGEKLYRGLVLNDLITESTDVIKHKEQYEFVSFSRDPDVACWFADPYSFINGGSGLGVESKDHLRGVIVEYSPKQREYLWHPRFVRHIKSFTFSVDAAMEEDEVYWMRVLGRDLYEFLEQYHWNLTSQDEAILLPITKTLQAKDFREYCSTTTEERDALYVNPMFKDKAL